MNNSSFWENSRKNFFLGGSGGGGLVGGVGSGRSGWI